MMVSGLLKIYYEDTYQRKLSGIFETLFGLLDHVVIITMKNHFAHNLSFFQDFDRKIAERTISFYLLW